ncbi:MAG TPA: hypothetical protein VJW75_00280 [Candidatus Eisenbacteria bacterium]|nr:hypothetical protein [Candidatus Eisenbacteria bacterium]
MSILSPRWLRLALALLVVGVAAFHAGRMFRAERALTDGEISLPLDDGFIYLQYSRAIAEGHPFVYTPGNDPTTGATSLWYPFLLLPPHLLRLSPALCIGWTLLLGLVGYVLSALLSARLGARLGGLGGGALALFLFLSSPFLLWGYMSGMELPLYGTALLATVLVYLRERHDARFPTLPWWLFALAGSRPEGAVLCGVFGLLAIHDRRRVARRAGEAQSWTPRLLLPFAAAALPFVVNLLVAGSIESTSSQAKSILAEPYETTRREYLTGAPLIWRETAALYLSMLELGPGGRIPAPIAWTNGAAVLLFLALAFVPRRRPWEGGLALVPLLALGIVLNSLPFSGFVHLLRYHHGLYTLVLVLLAAGWGRLAWLAWDRTPRVLGAALAAAALLIPLSVWIPRLLPEVDRVPLFYAHNCENILHQQVAVGRWIDKNLPKNAVVGMNDAGAIAYYGRRSTVDLVGLTSAGYARVYRSGLACLFEHVRRQPPERTPTYFAIYPEWFPYWPESGILGPEAFRAHLNLNTICGGNDKVVYPASWIDARAVDLPALAAPPGSKRSLVDSLDVAWLDDERRHDWSTEPEARDVLRMYSFQDRPTRPMTDGGRVVSGSLRFRVHAEPGHDLEMVMRTDAWYSSRLRITVDGRAAGTWEIAKSETAWVEPRFTIPGPLVARARPEIRIERELSGAGGNLAPFRFWFYQ